VNIYVAAVQALWINESHGETQKTIMLSYRNLLYRIKKRKKEKKKTTCKLFMMFSTILKLFSNEIERLKECLKDNKTHKHGWHCMYIDTGNIFSQLGCTTVSMYP
jgi:predicted RNA-binding protein with RPS1 domain